MDSALLERMRGATGLPSPPGIALSLLDSDPSDEAGAVAFARTSACDPAASAWILKFANARLMGRAAPIPSVRDAVTRLGPRATRVVVYSLMLVAVQSRRGDARAALQGVWSRALARGLAARALAEASIPRRAEEAFQAGVLAEVSRVALWCVEPETALGLARADERGSLASLEGEQDAMGCSAFAASADLLRWWRAPKRLWSGVLALDAEVMRREADARSEVTSEGIQLAGVLRAADRLAASLTGAAETFDTRVGVSLLAASEAKIAAAITSAERAWAEHRHLVEPLQDEATIAPEIERRVGAAVAELSLATQFENRLMKRRQDELLRRVTTDGLTGVKNRLAFDERLGEELERSQRSSKPLTLLLCDLDGFKSFNDRHGHQAGDLMLRAAAEAMAQAARRIDLVARYGGEEFAIIAPQCGTDGAISLAERLRRAVSETTIEWRGKTLGLTVSIGAAVSAGPGAPRTPADLIESADRLLYAAKEGGRDRVCVEPAATLPRAGEAAPTPGA